MNNDDFEKKLGSTPLRKIPDAWRAEILQYAAQPLPPQAPVPAAVSAANVTPPAPVPPPHIPSWRDLLWPCPRAWAALALIWLGIFVSNISFSSRQKPPVASTSAETLLVRLAQERTLVENRGGRLVNFIKRAARALFTRRMLGRLLFIAACIVTLIALLVIEEDWRGKRDWQAYAHAQKAKGEHLSMASFIPPPVPDDQNFAMTPLFAPIFAGQENTPNYGHYRSDLGDKLSIPTVEGKPRPHMGDRVTGKYLDLTAWRDYLGMDPLAWLKQFDPELREISKASRLPYARFPVDYAKGIGANTGHVFILIDLAKLYTLRAIAELHAEQTDAAFADVQTIFRLSESMKNEPFIISRLAQSSISLFGLQVLWEGLDEHRWSDARLQALQDDLSREDFLRELALAFRGERAALDDVILSAISNPEILNGMISPGDRGDGVSRLFRFIPSGVVYRNMLELDRFYDRYALASINPGAHRIDPQVINEGWQAIADASSSPHLAMFFYQLLERITMPPIMSVISKIAYEQTATDQAVIACALERYRLAHGQFPDTLAKLTPQYLKEIPPGVLDGNPPHYRLNNDGTYLLYSNGWSGKDEGGKPAMKAGGSGIDIMKGDWVWSVRPPPEVAPVKF